MSKLSEYSKFDSLKEDDGNSDDEDHLKPKVTVTPSVPQNVSPTAATMRKNKDNGRYVYAFKGKPIYEWEQSMEEVILYIPAPPFPTKEVHCNILPHKVQLGKKQFVQARNQYFLDEETFGTVEVSESTWTKEDDMLVIYLAKASKGEVWDVALKGNNRGAAAAPAVLDPVAKQEVQKEMMLERFQEENPGMDFRGAEFNGSVPDPRTFMGGVKYQ